MINDSGSLRPIYKDVNDVPRQIVSIFQTYAKLKLGNKLENFQDMNQKQLIDYIFEVCVPDFDKDRIRKD